MTPRRRSPSGRRRDHTVDFVKAPAGPGAVDPDAHGGLGGVLGGEKPPVGGNDRRNYRCGTGEADAGVQDSEVSFHEQSCTGINSPFRHVMQLPGVYRIQWAPPPNRTTLTVFRMIQKSSSRL